MQILLGVALIILGATLIGSVGYVMLIASFAGGMLLATGIININE